MNLLRAFSADKIVSSPLLNRMGLQVARTVASRAAAVARPPLHIPRAARPILTKVLRDGVAVIENFLPPARFAEMRSLGKQLLEDERCRSRDIGPITIRHVVMDELTAAEYRVMAAFYEDPRLAGTMACAERRSVTPTSGFRAIEQLVQRESSDHDAETDLHSDVFYHAHKAWLYLDEVDLPQAPLVYIPGSHRLDLRVLREVYSESCSSCMGSRRIGEDELRRSGLPTIEVRCQPNTLVIANIHGWHCRRRGEAGQRRQALHWSLRHNPFVPWN